MYKISARQMSEEQSSTTDTMYLDCFQFKPDVSNVKIEGIKSCNNNLTYPTGRYAAKYLNPDAIIDLTKDDKCFICNETIKNYYPLVKSMTNASKTQIVQKLGEILGKSYILIVSEDDFICENCINLFNRLDHIEIEKSFIQARITKNIENTYLCDGKVNTKLSKKFLEHLKNNMNSN